jgi:hypothetical protein
MTNIIYKKGNYYSTSKYKQPFCELGKYYNYYNYLIENASTLSEENLDMLIKSLCLFNHKDYKTNDIITIHLYKSLDKLKAATTIFYAYNKLSITDSQLIKECMIIIEQAQFTLNNRSNVIQIASTLSDMLINNQIIADKLDEFVIMNYTLLEEIELIMLFRYYSVFQIKNKLEILNYLAKRAIELLSTFSVNSIILLSKSLYDMNFKHIILLGHIRLRFETILQINTKNKLVELADYKLTADSFARVLEYLVRLDFLDPADYLNLENMFFILAAKQGINKDSAYIMFTTHCRFMRRIIVEERQEGSQEMKVDLRVMRRYKYKFII